MVLTLIMRTKIFIVIFLTLCVSEAYSQFKVNSDGSAQFQVGSYLAGYTGNSSNTNVSFGFGTLPNLLAGSYNTAYGYYALSKNTTGYNNTANGNLALLKNTTGGINTATGNCALAENTTGSGNTANGNLALQYNTTGNNNTANGYQALYSNTTGSLNTAIGYYAGANNPDNLTNTTAIGYQSAVTSSNQVRIGNSSVNSIGGSANWSSISDGRAKKNIKADVPGLDFINLLQPVTYNLDLDAMDNLLGIDKAKKDKLEKEMSQDLKDKNEKAKEAKEGQIQTGFVAQDVEKMAKRIGYDFSGVNVDEMGIYSLSYAEFVVPLVKAVQELSEQNEQLQQQINELKGSNTAFRSATNETETTGIVNPVAAQCQLYQNTPNPFKERTEIRYYLPSDVESADIYIFNLQGSLLKKIPATRSGLVEIKGSDLHAGMYIYTLVANGQTVDTKRMILTK